MLKTIWMSDLHFTAKGSVLGHDPRVRLGSAISHINQHHSDASYCLISGDLVNRGDAEDYAALSSVLSRLDVPVLPMAGNHDERSMLRASLPLPENCMANFIQYSVATPDGLIVCLDTQKSGADAGEFCAERFEWLERTLQGAADTPVYIFMHHPPMSLGLPMQDADNMENGAAFLDLLEKYACVKHLFIGHVHRPITGTVRGIPFVTMRSVLYQAPAPQPKWDWDTFKPSEEPPNLGVLAIESSDVTLQFVQFCKHEVGTAG